MSSRYYDEIDMRAYENMKSIEKCMKDKRTEALRNIQQLSFAMIELGLYLNNQPECERALDLFDKVKCMHEDARKKFESEFGPLNYERANTKKDGWSWISEPWPWEGED